MGTDHGTEEGRAVRRSRGEGVLALEQVVRLGERIDCQDKLSALTDAQPHRSWPESRHGPIPLITSGVSNAYLKGQVRAVCRVAAKGLPLVLRARALPHVVALGDQALHRLRPSVVGPLLQRSGCTSLAYARSSPAHVVADWARRCAIEFVPEGHLPRRIAMACRLDGQRLANEESISGLGGNEVIRNALVALQQTRDFRVKPWAFATGMSRHSLRRLCESTLGLAPEEIAWAFFDAKVRRECRHRRSAAQVATAVGVASAYALRRAYARRGLPFPGA